MSYWQRSGQGRWEQHSSGEASSGTTPPPSSSSSSSSGQTNSTTTTMIKSFATTAKDDEEEEEHHHHHHRSPLMTDERTERQGSSSSLEMMTTTTMMMAQRRPPPPPTNNDDDNGGEAAAAVAAVAAAETKEGYYSNDPLSAENNATSPPPPPHHHHHAASSQQQRPLSSSLSSSSSESSATKTMQRKMALLLPLLLSLCMLTDTDYSSTNSNEQQRRQRQRHNNHRHHHLAFVTALARHPPSLRAFRIAGEGAFLLACAAFALRVWEETANPPSGSVSSSNSGSGSGGSKKQRDNNNDFRAENDSDDDDDGAPRITPEAVGKLLFAPPPRSVVASNAAWGVLREGRRSFVRRRRERGNRRRRSGGGSGGSGEHVIEFHRAGEVDDEHESGDDDDIDEHENGSSGINNNDDVQLATDEGGEDDGELLLDFELQRQQQRQRQQQIPLPPSSASVLGAALDAWTITTIFLIFFTISSAEGGRYIDHHRSNINSNGDDDNIDNGDNDYDGSNDNSNSQRAWMKYVANIAAPLFPLGLFLIAAVASIVPHRKRKAIWTIVSLTVGAPFYPVAFRDGFVGDVLTSAVRPLQDLAFTVFFLPMGLRAWWSRELYTLDAAAVPLERSWILHTVLLPGCTLSPLWWRFLQNLRQCYDAKQRWPHLGNALKYFLAAEIAIFAVFDPGAKSSPWWIACFFAATLYQVWWDVFMDWGLLEKRHDVGFGYYHRGTSRNGGISGWFWWWPYTLRSRRLYKQTWVYYAIFAINFCLRFVGMITLIPPVYLSRSTGLIVNTYNNPDFQLFVGSMVACAEIFRRTIWALLRLEWEVIKTSSERRKSEVMTEEVRMSENNGDGVDKLFEEEGMRPMDIDTSGNKRRGRPFPFAAIKRTFSIASLGDMSNLNDIQILSELCVWATIFSGMAIIAAAHREVL